MTDINASSIRRIIGRVDRWSGSDLLDSYLPSDNLQEITITRTGEHGKFFGFGVCQQLTVKIVDRLGVLSFSKGDKLTTSFGSSGPDNYKRTFPAFYVKNVHRDEKTNVITLTAYDAIDNATAHTFNELDLDDTYSLRNVVEQVCSFLGLDPSTDDEIFDMVFDNGVNLAGDETLRLVLNAIAEITQTVYYADVNDSLVFRPLDKNEGPDSTITKADYFELSIGLPTTISKITHVTELGDNVEHGDDSGVTQYVRNNPFWSTSSKLDTLIPEAYDRIAGLTIIPYNLKCRGNYFSEIGDKIRLETKGGSFVDTFILDDTLSYTGGMTQTMSWEYVPDSDRETTANPANLGEKLNQTFAKVDKVNRTVQLVAKEVDGNTSKISALEVNTGSISASVEKIEKDLGDNKEYVDNELSYLRTEVDTKISAEDITITVQKELSNGIDKVITSTGYRLDEEGLNVSRSDSDISTTISHNGMEVAQGSEEVLVANKDGVKAQDLHATTYLIIGKNSRFEDYQGNRTACFWIGGN